MGKTKTIQKTYDQIARELTVSHIDSDPGTMLVYLARDPEEKEIRLLEITDSVETTGTVLPFRFRAQPKYGIPFPSTIILLTKKEWLKMNKNKLKLPDVWGPLEQLECLYERK